MTELHLKKPGFTCSACGSFTKHRERMQKFKETGNWKHLYRNELGKACFAHDAPYFDKKIDLAERTISKKISKDRAYESSRNRNHDWCQRALASIVHKFFNKKAELELSVNV